MKNCEYYELAVSRMTDGELTAAEESDLRSHMKDCPSCRRLYEDMSVLSIDLEGLSADPPAGLYDSVMDSIRREAAPVRHTPVRRAGKRRIWPGIAAAACLVLLIGGIGITVLRDRGRTDNGSMTMEAPAEAYAVAEEASAIPETAMAEAEEPELMADMADMAENAVTTGSGTFRDWTDPDTVPNGRTGDFEALLDDAGPSDDSGGLFVFYAAEYRGVIYEFLTDCDGRALWWQDAAEGYPVRSTHTADELWDIFEG